jgi:glycosyltransferase 2 family protein
LQKKAIKFLIFVSLGVLAMYYIFHTQQQAYSAECFLKGIPEAQCSLWDKIYNDFSKVNVWWLFVTMAIFMISNIVRALRWHIILEPLGVKPHIGISLGSILIGYLTNLVIPRAGEIARASYLAKYEDISVEKAIGTIISDRIIDVLCLLFVSLLTVILAYDKIFGYFNSHFDLGQRTAAISSKTNIVIAISILLLISGAVLYKYRSAIQNSKLGKKVISFLSGMWNGVISIRHMKQKGLFVLYSILIWTCYFLMAYVMFKAYIPTAHLGLTAGLVVFFFGSLGIVFPSPGGMGSYHFLAMESLSLYGVNSADAFTYANLNFFTVQVFANIFFGSMAMILMPMIKREWRKGGNALRQ